MFFFFYQLEVETCFMQHKVMWNRCTARHVFTYTRYVGDHCGRKISKNGKAAQFFRLASCDPSDQVSSPSVKVSYPIYLSKEAMLA